MVVSNELSVPESPYSASATSGWCRSKAGDSERIRGSVVKLCRGGGHEVAHSSERPKPQGSSTSTCSPYLAVFHTLWRNGSVDMPSRNAPIVERVLSAVNPSAAR